MGALTSAGLALTERYRESHHSVARLIAIGATHDHIRRLTGISFKRISIFLDDPAFAELVAHYKADVDKKWNTNVDTYLDLGMSNMIRTEAMIQDKLDEADEKGEAIPLLTLNRLSQDRADRFGYPKTSQVEHKLDFAALLDRAIERSGKAKEVKMIDVQAVEVSGGAEPLKRVSPSLPSGVEAPMPTIKASPPRPSIAAALNVKRRRVA